MIDTKFARWMLSAALTSDVRDARVVVEHGQHGELAGAQPDLGQRLAEVSGHRELCTSQHASRHSHSAAARRVRPCPGARVSDGRHSRVRCAARNHAVLDSRDDGRCTLTVPARRL